MMSLDELMNDAGVELDRLSALHDGRLPQRQPTPRRPLLLAGAVVMLVATAVGVYAVAERNTPQSSLSPDVPSGTDQGEPSTTATTDSVAQPLSSSTTVSVDGSALSETIDVGSSGPDVTLVQQRLTDLGFALGPVDGVFGAGTQQAVWAFKTLVGAISYEELAGSPQASEVTDQWWALMNSPVNIEPRRPQGVGTHVEVYLPAQVLILFSDDRPMLVAHVSSGELDDHGQPASWCETIVFDTDSNGEPLPQPVTSPRCGTSKTPGGVFVVHRMFEGQEIAELGGMYKPVFFNYSIAIHGAPNVPIQPVSHGAVRVSMNIADTLFTLVHVGDRVYVWGHDGKQPEEYTHEESLPSFPVAEPTGSVP